MLADFMWSDIYLSEAPRVSRKFWDSVQLAQFELGGGGIGGLA